MNRLWPHAVNSLPRITTFGRRREANRYRHPHSLGTADGKYPFTKRCISSPTFPRGYTVYYHWILVVYFTLCITMVMFITKSKFIVSLERNKCSLSSSSFLYHFSHHSRVDSQLISQWTNWSADWQPIERLAWSNILFLSRAIYNDKKADKYAGTRLNEST